MNMQMNLFEELFEMFSEESPTDIRQSKYAVEEPSTEIRLSKQKNKKISHDVGYVGGARKDIEEMRRRFLAKPNKEDIAEIAEVDEVAANELVKKANVFQWFSMEECHKRDVSVQAAYGMSLFIRRIPELNKLSIARSVYLNVLLFISSVFQEVKTRQHFIQVIERLYNMCLNGKDELVYLARRVSTLEEEIEILRNYPEDVRDLQNRQQKVIGQLLTLEIGASYGLHQLGAVTELLISRKKIMSLKESTTKYGSWESYWEENGQKESRKGIKNKPIWERQLPAQPKRVGGRNIENIRSPETFKELFGFRAVEFGLWVKDEDGLGHINSCAKAFMDLADVLNINHGQLSLGNQLAMAFGARGSGRALAHFESGYNVINLTKQKGSLGVLAHEWFHGLDYFLNNKIVGEPGFLTAGDKQYMLPMEVFECYYELICAIQEGQSTGYVDVSKAKGKYRLSSSFIRMYNASEGNLQDCMDERLTDFNEQMYRHLSTVFSESGKKQLKEKYARKRKRILRETAEALAQLHKEMRGEEVTKIPYTTNQTQYYRTALELDKERVGHYFSKPIELTARAFESYIHSLLKERGWQSDYLVAGIDYIYPQDEEAEKIHAAMREFLNVTIHYL